MLNKLPPRERQIVDLLYARGEATAAEICRDLESAPSSGAVRAMLSRLQAKGFVTRRREDGIFVFAPTLPTASAKESALSQVVRTFFNGRPAGAASALLGMSEQMDAEEIRNLERLIARAKKREQSK